MSGSKAGLLALHVTTVLESVPLGPPENTENDGSWSIINKDSQEFSGIAMPLEAWTTSDGDDMRFALPWAACVFLTENGPCFTEEKEIPEHMMIEGFRWSIGPSPAKITGWRG